MKHTSPGWLFLALVLVSSSAATAEVRTWTDRSGQYQIEAELVDVADGVARLRRADGGIVSVALENLSIPDQEYVSRQSAGRPEDGGAATDKVTGESAVALIELLSGARVEGQITARDDQAITLSTIVGRRTLTRKYPIDRIHAVTIGAKREVFSDLSSGDGGSASGAARARVGTRRSPAEIDRLIDQLGRTPPEWWDSVGLNYPQSLDLSWPQTAPGQWNAQKNVGQYLWDIIQPNPGKWQEGVRFVHFLLEHHKDDRQKRQRAMMTLGRLYYLLLQDYARASFWWRQAGVGRTDQSPAGVNLAACYWMLGNKQMALDLLRRIPIYYPSIKLLADMGETQRALQIAEAGARGGMPDLAYVYAGDACRTSGQYEKAIQYFQKVLDLRPAGKQAKRIERNQQRARANIDGIKTFDSLDLGRVADGTYRGTSPAYAGQLDVEVLVRGGRIESVEVTKHQEKQYYTALIETPRKIIAQQGFKGVDATTSATITSEAIINATAKALASGMQ